ncbi:MAG: hypothetical protein KC964_27995, partial [Candidatus Omnitrophica bacterium]|nr:hypothetical protein [Candidatus Omnitrophota bacterium]
MDSLFVDTIQVVVMVPGQVGGQTFCHPCVFQKKFAHCWSWNLLGLEFNCNLRSVRQVQGFLKSQLSVLYSCLDNHRLAFLIASSHVFGLYLNPLLLHNKPVIKPHVIRQ